MFDNLKSFLLKKAIDSRLHFFKPDSHLTDFSGNLTNTKTILIVLPVKAKEFELASQYLDRFKELFNHARILTLDISSIGHNQVNWFGIPTHKYLSGIQAESYDLFIDLNSRHERVSCYICAYSNSTLRVHLSEGRFDKLYNLHFRTNGRAPLATRYENLLTYLAVLMSRTVAK